MKKLSILFLSVVALGMSITSCTKSDPAPTIVAKWNYTTYTHTTGSTTTAPTPVTPATCTDKSFLNLQNGGALAQQLVSGSTCTASTANGTYTYSNNTLHVTTNDSNSTPTTVDYPVVSLTSSTLVIKNINPKDATEYLTITLTK